MNKLLFTVYRVFVPKPFRTVILKKSLRRKILKYYASLPENEVNDEQREILKYLENNQIRIFPYPFHENYSSDKIEVVYDKERGMRYVLHKGERLYFRKRWNEKRIKRAYSDLLREQDNDSPHRYLTGTFTVGENDVIADIGAAEGNFSLEVIDKVKKIYIFEHNKYWIEALKATFAPWPEKVEIIGKYVSDINVINHIKLDTFFEDRKDITFLKIDVDGAEAIVLNSCKDIFKSDRPLKVVLCTYHKNNDEKVFTELLKNQGFIVKPSKGYMINYYDKKLETPYFRRGLIRAEK